MKSVRIALLLSFESPRKVDFLLLVCHRNQLIPPYPSEQLRCEHPHAPCSCCHLNKRLNLLEAPSHTRRSPPVCFGTAAAQSHSHRGEPGPTGGGGCGSSGLSPPRFPLKKQLFIRTVREVETGSSRPGHGSELALALSVLLFLHLSLFFPTQTFVFSCAASWLPPTGQERYGSTADQQRVAEDSIKTVVSSITFRDFNRTTAFAEIF